MENSVGLKRDDRPWNRVSLDHTIRTSVWNALVRTVRRPMGHAHPMNAMTTGMTVECVKSGVIQTDRTHGFMFVRLLHGLVNILPVPLPAVHL